MATLTLPQCWARAHDEHPADPVARKTRYVALLKEHGHVIARPVGEGYTPGLPCGFGREATR